MRRFDDVSAADAGQWAEIQKEINIVYFAGPYDFWTSRYQDPPEGWWRNLPRSLLGNRIVEIEGNPFVDESCSPATTTCCGQ